MGSSARTGKFFIGGSQEHFFGSKTKVPFGIGHPSPIYTSNLVYMCAGGFRGPKSSNRIELSRVIVILLIWVSSAQGGGAGVWGGFWGDQLYSI